MTRWIIILVALAAAVVAAAGGYWYWHRTGAAPAFRTAAVQRGDLQSTISATGTVEPEEVVDIGAQVAGQVKSLGQDPKAPAKSVDYGTAVEEGTVLARIDDALYASDVEQAQAAVEAAKASAVRAEKDLGQLDARFEQARSDWERVQDLKNKGATISPQEYETYKANFLSTQASVQVGHASIDQAKKAVAQAQATLNKAEKNLGYCTIKSPVKGVIIDRRVNVGQTVVSSLNAPSLFLIAKDLKRMQVWASVNEADIGRIHPGQPVTFTVDAYPSETFVGEVNKIRLNATMTQNVVTYTVEVTTDNSSGKLLPYLTANLQFEIGRRTNVLLVPNAALRWWPQPGQIVPGSDSNVKAKRGKSETADKEASDRGVLWIAEGNYVRPIPVKVGVSDGALTEVEGDGVKEGMEFITGEARKGGGDSTSNPFTPKMFGGNSGGNRQQ